MDQPRVSSKFPDRGTCVICLVKPSVDAAWVRTARANRILETSDRFKNAGCQWLRAPVAIRAGECVRRVAGVLVSGARICGTRIVGTRPHAFQPDRTSVQLVGVLDRLSRRDGHWHTCQQPPTDAVMWWWGGLKGTVRFSQPERQGGSADSSRDARIHT